jgi:hypothetical protein
VPKYGEAAVTAVRLAASGGAQHIVDAWEEAVGRIFPDSPSSRAKNCPRCAFLGLCEEGLVRGVAKGSYTRSKLNKRYAVSAARKLRDRPALADDPDQLWQLVVEGAEKVENSQMDVVVTLWKRGLLA